MNIISAPGGELSLIGIVDAEGFREAVLKQRESVGGSTPVSTTENEPQVTADSSQVLGEIRDCLLRIEASIERTDKPGGA